MYEMLLEAAKENENIKQVCSEIEEAAKNIIASCTEQGIMKDFFEADPDRALILVCNQRRNGTSLIKTRGGCYPPSSFCLYKYLG